MLKLLADLVVATAVPLLVIVLFAQAIREKGADE